jgi:glycosyltransferase involved in cell wall biosynthesis
MVDGPASASPPAAPYDVVHPAPKLSVVVKALNEAAKIEACLKSILAATDPASTEIIVADSLSDDATVAIASQYPVTVVQLTRPADRGCGTAAQLGFQYARGERILLLDGDMELAPDFLPAAHQALDADPKLAGVGGLVIDKVMTLEFQRRQVTMPGNSQPGIKQHLNGGGLFRAEAFRETGYLTDRNLHACEEFELGSRLSAAGWHFLRLDLPSVYHYGHATPPYRLLRNRWRSKYLFGQGELLRAALGGQGLQRRRSLRSGETRLYLIVVAWWLSLLVLLAGMVLWPLPSFLLLVAAFIAPFAAQYWRKRNLAMSVYAMALLSGHAAGMIAGFLRPRIDPRNWIDSVVKHRPS